MKKDTQQLKDLSIDELNHKLLELRKEQFQLRMKKASNDLAAPHKITFVRRSIARIKTIMTEKVGKSHVNQ
jgi:large subunit ribosomal protein L29